MFKDSLHSCWREITGGRGSISCVCVCATIRTAGRRSASSGARGHLNPSVPGRLASFPFDYRTATLIADTIKTRLDGELRVLQYAGRLAELVAYTLDVMQNTPVLRGSVPNRKRDVEIAHNVIERLAR
jgi:hypothetical protein